jgi:hypothetical protein
LTVAMLPLYQSAVNCSSRNVQGNFIHKIHYLLFSFPGLGFM